MKKVNLFSSLIIVVGIGSLIFIHFSNDHKECSNSKEIITSNNGKTIKTTNKHICKEKYNF